MTALRLPRPRARVAARTESAAPMTPTTLPDSVQLMNVLLGLLLLILLIGLLMRFA